MSPPVPSGAASPAGCDSTELADAWLTVPAMFEWVLMCERRFSSQGGLCVEIGEICKRVKQEYLEEATKWTPGVSGAVYQLQSQRAVAAAELHGAS
jgi:hypothetical protein